MKLSGLLHRSRPELPGLSGVARVDRRTDALLRRIKAGEIAVLDQVDLDRATADALVAAEVAAVVNASPSISGRFPNLGPEVLVAAGIPLLDDVGTRRAARDQGRQPKIRLHDGVVYAGELRLAEGVVQTADTVADAMVEAKSGLTHQLEAFAANTIGVHAPRAGRCCSTATACPRSTSSWRTGRCWSSPPGSTTPPSWRGSRTTSASTARCWSASVRARTRCSPPGTPRS